jgi:NAD(P)H-dependent flavin oxidoreductase YrpB (nitropropane dioxygenase family)
VIAAGGIADGRGIAAAFMLGASAAQIGTAYLRCPESLASAVHKSALANARDDGTALTNVFTGRPARAIVNRFMREMAARRQHPGLPGRHPRRHAPQGQSRSNGLRRFLAAVGWAVGRARQTVAGQRTDAEMGRGRDATDGRSTRLTGNS